MNVDELQPVDSVARFSGLVPVSTIPITTLLLASTCRFSSALNMLSPVCPYDNHDPSRLRHDLLNV